jgi:hypothetical protein
LNQITDLYLLDFVGPPGFVQEISTKVPRYQTFKIRFKFTLPPCNFIFILLLEFYKISLLVLVCSLSCNNIFHIHISLCLV